MRNAFANTITQLAARDERVVLLSGDIGNRMFDRFKEAAPGRFFNVGIAEQHMIGFAAGLALRGLRPYCYTITPFVTARCYEQLRIDAAYHRLPITIVGTGAGLAYANLGPTHMGTDDIALMRSLPGFTVVCPGDPHEVEALTEATLTHSGPIYLRLGKKGEAAVHASKPQVTLGKALPLRRGRDAVIFSTGNMLPLAVEAADRLAAQNIRVGVWSCHTVQPLDELMVEDACLRYPLLATLEEHSLVGGLGSAVAEWLIDHAYAHVRLLRFGIDRPFRHDIGSPEYTRELHGLTPEAVAHRLAHTLRHTAYRKATA